MRSLVTMDFDESNLNDIFEANELVGGSVGVTSDGRLCIYGPGIGKLAALINDRGSGAHIDVEQLDDDTLGVTF